MESSGWSPNLRTSSANSEIGFNGSRQPQEPLIAWLLNNPTSAISSNSKPGAASVTLEITSYVNIGKKTEPVPIRVLQDTWIVEAHGIEWAKYQIEQIEPIRAFLVAIAAAIVAVFAHFADGER